MANEAEKPEGIDSFVGVSEPDEPVCLGCGYLLLGLTQHQCPECGRSFDPTRPQTFTCRSPRPRRPIVWWAASLPLVIQIIGMALFYVYWFNIVAELGHQPQPYVDDKPHVRTAPFATLFVLISLFNFTFGWVVWPLLGFSFGALCCRKRPFLGGVLTALAMLLSCGIALGGFFVWFELDPGEALNWYFD